MTPAIALGKSWNVWSKIMPLISATDGDQPVAIATHASSQSWHWVGLQSLTLCKQDA